MQEVYYVYKPRKEKGFKLIPDRGRRLTEIEVDVSIAHQENVPLGSVKWHKVIVNSTDKRQEQEMPRLKQKASKPSWHEKLKAANGSAYRWESLLSMGAPA